jgi:hypothetical protein
MARHDAARTRAWVRRVLIAGVAVGVAVAPGAPVAGATPPPTDPPRVTAVAPEPPAEAPPVVTAAPTPSPTTAAPPVTAKRAVPPTTRAPIVVRPTPTTRSTAPKGTAPRPSLPRDGEGPTPTAGGSDAASTMSLPLPATTALPPQTSCRAVVQIGDSLSVGLDSPSYIKDPDARISRRYAAIGVRTLRLESSGGRSVVEHLERQDGGEAVAKKVREAGFHGCWVIALGTNDAANIDAGSSYGYSERIDRMMAVIGDDPVLWVDVKTDRTTGHYAGEHMRMFNAALAKAHARYPALQVYAWSDVVADDWFQGDGIHYTVQGDAYRAALVPAALAAAFPAD